MQNVLKDNFASGLSMETIYSPWKKKKNLLLFFLHILFDNKIRAVIKQQVLTVVWPQEWFRQHMFPKELLGEGPDSVYLFLMKPAVALMADIFNRPPSHTEENNKQRATSVWQCCSLLCRPHMFVKVTVSALRLGKAIHSTAYFHLPSVCLCLYTDLLGTDLL